MEEPNGRRTEGETKNLVHQYTTAGMRAGYVRVQNRLLLCGTAETK